MTYLNGAAILCGLVAGVCIGYMAWGRQVVPIVETKAVPEWHDDGSLTAMRDPAAKPVTPAPTVPKGVRVVRTVEVTVKPDPMPTPATECPPVTVRMDMTAHDDGLRVSMVAQGGEILDAIDIPRDTIYMPRETKHVVGLERINGASVLRYGMSFGALDVGPSVALNGDGRVSVGGWIGYRF